MLGRAGSLRDRGEALCLPTLALMKRMIGILRVS